MPIGFVIFFWMLVGGVLLGIYAVLNVLSEGSKTFTLLKKVFAAATTAVAIPLVLLVIVNTTLNFFPGYVFKSSFGFSPPPDVTELKGRKSVFGDSGDIYLRFRASKQTIERIVRPRLVEVGLDEYKYYPQSYKETAPSYWRPFEGKPTHFYESHDFDDSFASSSAVLIYDEPNCVAHFHWVGID